MLVYFTVMYMNIEDVLNYKEEIFKFTINVPINNYESFVNYFYKLDSDTKNDIVFYTMLYVKYKEYLDIKNGNIEKIYNFYKILLRKLEYDKLNVKDKYLYEYVNAYLILFGEYKNDKLFDKYCNEYLVKTNKNNFNKEIFLILQDLINILNKKYNKSYTLCLVEQKPIAATNWMKKERMGKICLRVTDYIDYFLDKNTSSTNIIKTLTNQIFIILHEYKHLLQMDEFYSSRETIKEYERDLYLISVVPKRLYNKYHENFIIEKEANEFAYDNFFKCIKKYTLGYDLDEKELKKFIKTYYIINAKDKKMFLLQYKMYLNYLKLSRKTGIKTKTLRIFNKLVNDIKEDYRQ